MKYEEYTKWVEEVSKLSKDEEYGGGEKLVLSVIAVLVALLILSYIE